MFSAVFAIIFIDRGGWASCLSRIEYDYKLTNLEGGLLGAAFMIGYMVAAIIFAYFSTSQPPFMMMAWYVLYE